VTRAQRKQRTKEIQARVQEDASRRAHQEEVLLVVRDALQRYYTARGLTKSRVSDILNRPESFVNYSLSGRNMTLRTLADLTLGARVEIRIAEEPTA
jgi:hypothetical protein